MRPSHNGVSLEQAQPLFCEFSSAGQEFMNAIQPLEGQVLELVDIIDLKWLMARDGHHVHVERLQADPVYARECLAKAAGSSQDAVQAFARRLWGRCGFAGEPIAQI